MSDVAIYTRAVTPRRPAPWAAAGAAPTPLPWWRRPAGPLLWVATFGGLAVTAGGCPCCGQPFCLTGMGGFGLLGLVAGAWERWRARRT